MSLTCNWAKETFCHIVTVVFQKTLDSSFVKILEEEGCTDVISILSLWNEDISKTALSTSDKHLLITFKFFHLHRLLNGYSAHDLISVTQDEFKDFRKSQHCPVIPSSIMDTPPVPASKILAIKSTQPLPPSSPVKLQAIPTPFVPVLLNTDSATSMTMVDDLILDATPDPVTTSDPCQGDDDTSDPCIDLHGGETLPYQLHPLSADLEPKKSYPLDPIPTLPYQLHPLLADLEHKKSYPLDPIPQDASVTLLPSLVDSASLTPKPSQKNVDPSEVPVSNAVFESTKYQEPVIPTVAQAILSPPVAALLHADSATNAMSDDILSYAQPPQTACFPTAPTATPTAAPTAFDRPPAAPDPIQGATLLKPSDPANDCTLATSHSEAQHAHPADQAVQPITAPQNNHAHPPDKAVQCITSAHNNTRFGHSSLPPVLACDPNSAMPYYPSSVMIPCPDNIGYCILVPYQHLLQLVQGMTKKTYILETNQDGPQTRNNKEMSYTASRKFPVEEGTFYASVESPFTPDDLVGDLIALLSSDLLPSPSNRLARDPLEEMCLTYYCNQHPLACGVTSPLIFPCINNKHLPLVLDTLATLKCFDLLYNQCSFLVSDKVPTQCSLVNLCVPILEDIEEEIIFYYSDDEGYDNEDVLMAIEVCMPFGTQLFPHHDDRCSQQYLCEVVPSSRAVIFIDGEPLPVTTEEPSGEKSAIGEPTCFGDPKDTITSSAGFYLDTYGLNQDPALIASTSDGEQTILENLAGYTQRYQSPSPV